MSDHPSGEPRDPRERETPEPAADPFAPGGPATPPPLSGPVGSPSAPPTPPAPDGPSPLDPPPLGSPPPEPASPQPASPHPAFPQPASDPFAAPPPASDPFSTPASDPDAPPPASDPFAAPPPAVDPFSSPYTPPPPGPHTPPPPSSDPFATPPAGSAFPPPGGYGPQGQPGYGMPGYGQPGYTAPGPPEYGQPGYSTPGQPGYSTPGQQGYPTPGQPDYPAPGQTGFIPGQPGYPAPGQPGFGAPPPGYPPYGQPPPGYGYPGMPPLPQSYYADPSDPLVSADYSGWWSRSFRLVQATWQPIALIQLISVIPTAILTIIGLSVLAPRFDELSGLSDTSGYNWSRIVVPAVVLAAVGLIVVLLRLLTNLAGLQIAVQRATGQPVSIGAALLDALKRLPAFIGWGLLAGLIVLGGVLFCILPAFYFAAVFAVLSPIVLLERENAISRSFQLFHADLGASIGRIATLGGLTFGLGVIESIVSGIFTNGAGTFGSGNFGSGTAGTAAVIVSEVISAVFSIASGALFTPMSLTTYADLRARREPFHTGYLLPR